MTKAIFTPPFIGKNLSPGIVLNSQLPFGKEAAYEVLKGETHSWCRLLLVLGLRLFIVFNHLPSDERESVLIIDDSPYDRSRSKWVELLATIGDHGTGLFLKGLRMLTICWSDGTIGDFLTMTITSRCWAKEVTVLGRVNQLSISRYLAWIPEAF